MTGQVLVYLMSIYVILQNSSDSKKSNKGESCSTWDLFAKISLMSDVLILLGLNKIQNIKIKEENLNNKHEG